MTDLRGWNLPEQHLLPDAVVAFVDGEMSATARDRAAAHMVNCSCCAAEISAQRQARAAVRAADAPCTPAALLASLRAIPNQVDLPDLPDELAVTQDGQFVAVQRPGKTPLGASPALGSSPRLGQGAAVLGFGRRTAQGAGVVVSGLVLGALAFVAPSEPAGGAAAEPAPPPTTSDRMPLIPAVAPVLVRPGPIVR